MSKTKKTIIALAILLLFVLVAVVAFIKLSPAKNAGEKALTFEVTHTDGSVKSFDIKTDSETLRAALESEGLISGDESEYGLYVTAVDGESADAQARQWWCFTRDGEMLTTGVDDTPISDGEHYEAFIDTY